MGRIRRTAGPGKYVNQTYTDWPGTDDPTSDWIGKVRAGITPYSGGNHRSQLTPIIPVHGTGTGFIRPWFHWPTVNSSSVSTDDNKQYTVTIRPYGGGTTVAQFTSIVPYNYARCTVDLTPGTQYEWKVNDPVSGDSAWRAFYVRADAIACTAPTVDTAYSLAATTARPRFKISAEQITAYTSGAGLNYFNRMKVLFDNNGAGGGGSFEGDALPADPADTSTVQTELWKMLVCCHLYWITGEAQYRTEATRRAVNMLSWSVSGNAVTTTNDDGRRFLQQTLALYYDTFGSDLNASQLATLHDMFGYRLNLALTRVDSAKMIDPAGGSSAYGRWFWHLCLFSGHHHNNLACDVVTALALAGDESTFAASYNNLATNIALFAKASEVLVAQYYPFVYEDGGMPEGISYGSPFLFSPAVDAISNCYGSNFWNQPRQKNRCELFSRLYPYSLGYGQGFGDDHELKWSSQWLTAQAGRVRNSHNELQMNAAGVTDSQLDSSQWYYGLFQASPKVRPDPNDATWTNAFWSSDGGILATHSDIYNPNRTTMWFMSPRNGAWNHLRPCTNAFTIMDSAVRIIQNAGHYDGTNTTHGTGYDGYAEKARNVISLASNAGGQTSNYNNNYIRTVTGRFSATDRKECAYWVSDGTASYQLSGYEHDRAVRAVVHIRPNCFVVIDDHILTAGSQTWEWNFHTQNFQGVTAAPTQAAGTTTFTFSGGHGLPTGTTVKALVTDVPATEKVVSSIVISAGTATVTTSTAHGYPLGTSVGILIRGVTSPSALNGIQTCTVVNTTTFTFATAEVGAVSGTMACNLCHITDVAVPNTTTVTMTTGGITSATWPVATYYLIFGPSSSGAPNAITVGKGVTSNFIITPLTGAGITSPTSYKLNDCLWPSGNSSLSSSSCNANSFDLGSKPFRAPILMQFHNWIQWASAGSLFSAVLIEKTTTRASSITASVSGAAPNKVLTITLTYNGKVWTIVYTQATKTLTVV